MVTRAHHDTWVDARSPPPWIFQACRYVIVWVVSGIAHQQAMS